MKISSQINVATQRNVKENKNIAKTTNLTKVNGSFVDLLNFKAQINKVNIGSKSNLSFKGACLIGKEEWSKASLREKQYPLKVLSMLFGYKEFKHMEDSTYKMLFHPDFDRFKKRMELAQYFSGYSEEYIPCSFEGWYSYKDHIRCVEKCYFDNDQKYAEEEAEIIDFALFLIKKICPVGFKYTSLPEEEMEIFRPVLNKIVDSKNYMKKIGFSISKLQKAVEQYQKGKELSEEQLDILADLRLYINPDSWSYLFDEAFNSKLEERVQKQEFVNYPDGAKSEIIRTKYSTYYGIKNGTSHTFVCKSLTKSPYCKDKGMPDYKIKFPIGTWEETQKQPFYNVYRRLLYAGYYDKQQVKSGMLNKKHSITLPGGGENYFIKIED
ncbi:MAG: hypothetical protein IKU37_00250 [Candidatus Gastranaerophilales bacterium]|nr:hypothetical protein [Candidatus Gastranaerophilales bacterium]